MGSPQSTIYAFGQPSAVAGEATYILDEMSAINAEASTNIGFGLGVKPGVKTKEALLPTAGSSVFLGVNRQQATNSPGTFGNIDDTSTPPGMKPDTQLAIVRKGRCWVQVDADTSITPNVTRAWWRFETDGASNTLVGTFRDDDDGHVVDTTKQAMFVSDVFTAPDGSKIAELDFDAGIKP